MVKIINNFPSIRHFRAGFTLIELLVVVAVIGLLATFSIVSLNRSRIISRDAKRKADLRDIRMALELYYNDYGLYPQASGCVYGSNCYVYSTAASAVWIPALAEYTNVLPRDPKNTGGAPWGANGLQYAYGNVTADGQAFDLSTHLENESDPDRCEVKKYRFYFNNQVWCGGYSGQIYENSPLTPL